MRIPCVVRGWPRPCFDGPRSQVAAKSYGSKRRRKKRDHHEPQRPRQRHANHCSAHRGARSLRNATRRGPAARSMMTKPMLGILHRRARRIQPPRQIRPFGTPQRHSIPTHMRAVFPSIIQLNAPRPIACSMVLASTKHRASGTASVSMSSTARRSMDGYCYFSPSSRMDSNVFPAAQAGRMKAMPTMRPRLRPHLRP